MAWLWSADPQLQHCKTSPCLGAFQPPIPKVSPSNLGWLHQASWAIMELRESLCHPATAFLCTSGLKKNPQNNRKRFSCRGNENISLTKWDLSRSPLIFFTFNATWQFSGSPSCPTLVIQMLNYPPSQMCLLKICLKCILISYWKKSLLIYCRWVKQWAGRASDSIPVLFSGLLQREIWLE